MGQTAPGEATSISSLFPVEESQKAAKRVQDFITERQKELYQLHDFIADNNSLINLVQRLPDELDHQIMVPFGKAAFFPGELTHTNEFLILLGEGYYAERTAKQTVDILKRRGKQLDSQVESLKAVMEDLQAEASFFDATAAEAAEGLVEIREDYVEQTSTSNENVSAADNNGARGKDYDEEYARIMSRIEELEKEEEEEEEPNVEVEKDEEKEAENKDEDESNDADVGHNRAHLPVDHKVKSLEFEGSSKTNSVLKDAMLHGRHLASNKSSSEEKASMLPEDNVKNVPAAKTEAFTGSVVERTFNLASNQIEQTAPRTSKPVSRFKMQRR